MTTCCVIGLGYIGLPTAAVLARSGHRVFGVDTNQQVVDTVNKGLVHIIEPDLDQLISDVVADGLLTAHTAPSVADVFLIAVPTPFKKTQDQSIPQPDLSYVLQAAASLAPFLQKGNLVILESTSPTGTTELLASLLCKESGLSLEDLYIAYCPERVLPGRILHELISNDRVVGGITSTSSEAATDFYSTFCHGDILATSSRIAEMVKLSENSYRDVNIAFANELSLVCHDLNIDVTELIRLANHHPRDNILNPGCGVGGHCIAVDPWFIAAASPRNTHLIQAARHVNSYKPQWVVQQVLTHVKELTQKLGCPITVGIFGLAFKPDVDDLRESPALTIATKLLQEDLSLLVSEPNITSHELFSLSSIEEITTKAHVLVFLVSHSSYKSIELDPSKYVILDLCGVTKPL